MEVNRGDTVIEGIDVIIKRDLDKHKSLLDRNNLDIQAIHGARAGEIGRKKFYKTQIGERKYKKEAMERAIAQMNNNIARHSSTLIALQESKVFNTNIVDTLTRQLEEYYINIRKLKPNLN